ncbi:MAG: methionine--tRNA ligase [Candidatus Doudnabacteria bacterium]
MSKTFYITTTLPYVNSDPHVGFAMEIIRADVLARYHSLRGEEVFFNTGTDEHGQKIYQKATEAGQDVQEYVDGFAKKFKDLKHKLNIFSDLNFIRTTDEHHVKAAQEFWKACDANGDIYKKEYQVKYCVGCELEKTDSELEDGHCAIHPNMEIELIEEENYFFKFEEYGERLLALYEKNPEFVLPDFRLNEIKKFVQAGLQDFSISRLKDKMPWGVPVPGDDTQVMYVWFDALVNYISALGWPEDQENFEKFWGTNQNPNAIQVAGKDNLRQQSAMWQAMLMSAGLPTSKQIFINGFINSGGRKMSKSLGNVISPYEMLDKLQDKGLTEDQAIDALRYYLLREIPTFDDGDFTWERFVETYNANLANGIGNLVSRILHMAVSAEISSWEVDATIENSKIDQYLLDKATDELWGKIAEQDKFIQSTEPYKTIKTDPETAKKDIEVLLGNLSEIALELQPFLPHTADQILEALKDIKKENIPRLFPRIIEE